MASNSDEPPISAEVQAQLKEEFGEESDEYDDIEEEEEEEAGGFEEDDEDVVNGQDVEAGQRQASLTALLVASDNDGVIEVGDELDDDEEYDEEEELREEYTTADGKAPPSVAGSVTSVGVKRSRGELGEDEGAGVVGSGDSVGDEGFEEEGGDEDDEQSAKRVKV